MDAQIDVQLNQRQRVRMLPLDLDNNHDANIQKHQSAAFKHWLNVNQFSRNVQSFTILVLITQNGEFEGNGIVIESPTKLSRDEVIIFLNRYNVVMLRALYLCGQLEILCQGNVRMIVVCDGPLIL